MAYSIWFRQSSVHIGNRQGYSRACSTVRGLVIHRIPCGVPVVLLRLGLQFFAISATCPHAGGPLDEGALQGDVVECPWHGSRFCIRDGRVLSGPATVNAPRYDVRLRDGHIEVKRGGISESKERLHTSSSSLCW